MYRRPCLVGTMVFLVMVPLAACVAAEQSFSIQRLPHGIGIECGGEPFAEYVIDQGNKPFLWPVFGPTGKQMTRGYPMVDATSEPAEQRDHPHQRGISFGHEDCFGDTWGERATYESKLHNEATAARAKERIAGLGTIKHVAFTRLDVHHGERDRKAVVEATCEYHDPVGRVGVTERRRLTFRATDSLRMIDCDQDLVATGEAVRIGDRKDAGLYIRVPVALAVDSKQGGRIVNSEGLSNDAAWAQPARWCDYHGRIDGDEVGVAILNHPSSFRHPTRWHVRTYGLFAANPFAQNGYDKSLPDASITLNPGEVLRLRHRFVFHTGDDRESGIEEAWQAYAQETPEDFAPLP
jgi:hypothetical protein